jgi:exodeoxyribonuclease VII large subunit
MQAPDFDMESDPLRLAGERVWTVSQVTLRIKDLVEGDPAFLRISVRGEVTNLSTSKAGHVYFGLKDAQSYLKCVAFRSDALKLQVKPAEGREVVASGRINVWEAGGTYQLIVNQLQDIGLGALWLQFEETREKLAKEGLFDEEIKRPLPMFPRLVGIVTSATGAALRDMIRIFGEHAPYVSLILSPSLVQGETAPASLIAAVDLLELWDEMERSEGRKGLDLIIIGRGGGSFEDLACFNDEGLVRRIRRTRVPVISAVGHEIDFTIIDFAADVRAATPTQAATIAAPSADELRLEVANLLAELRQAAEMKAETYRTGLSNLLSRPVYRRPMDRVANLRQNLDVLSARILRAVRSRLNVISHRLQSAVNRLETLDPTTILARGYSLAFNRETGRLITRVAQGLPGTPVDLRVCDGILKLRTEEGDEAP